MYDDRFCGHRTMTMGKPTGYISGNYRQNESAMIIETKRGKAGISWRGCIDQTDPDTEIDW